MTLLSMCMNLMQEQIVEKVSWIAEELGMKGDGNDEEVVKLSREVSENLSFKTGSIICTPFFRGKLQSLHLTRMAMLILLEKRSINTSTRMVKRQKVRLSRNLKNQHLNHQNLSQI